MHHFFLLLSLSGKIDAFIKHGEKKATVEIELQRNPGSVVIKREIEQGGARGKTAWYIDGKGCKEEEVKKLTKSQWRKGYIIYTLLFYNMFYYHIVLCLLSLSFCVSNWGYRCMIAVPETPFLGKCPLVVLLFLFLFSVFK